MRLITGALAVLLATGCAAGSSSPPTAAPQDTPAETLPATPDTPTGHPRTACQAFALFYSDLTSYTPHATALLTADASRVQALAMRASGRRLLDDAAALVGRVSSASWSESGSALDPAVGRLMDDCQM